MTGNNHSHAEACLARFPFVSAAAVAVFFGAFTLGLEAELATVPQPGVAPVLSGCEPDYLPYCIVTPDQQADGFSVELLRAALQAVGREVVFRTGPAWPALKQDLADGRLQVLPLVGRTPEREALFDFTFPYLTMHGTIVVREGTNILVPADLKARQVAVLQGDNAEEYLRRANLGALVVPRPSFETALRELSGGQHEAVVIQKLLALQLMQKAGLTNLVLVGPPIKDFTQSFCFAVRQGDSELLAALNEGLAIVMADGTYRALHTKWFSALEALGRTKSRIVVGGDSNYPPYEFLDRNGQPAGFNVAITRAIARQMGLPIEIRLGTWSSIRKGLGSGDIDMVQGMFYSVEREREFTFSPPHAIIQHSIVVRTGTPVPVDMKDLAGKSVLVMAGDIMEDLAKAQGYGGQLVAVPTQQEALRLLAAGQHDGALVAKVPALYWIAKNGWRNLRVSELPVASAEYCYAVLHGNDGLLSQVSEGLAALKASGEFRRIQNEWLGPYEGTGMHRRTVVKYLLVMLVPLLALLTAAFLWSRSLQRQVAIRTQTLQQEVAVRHSAEAALRVKEAELLAVLDATPFPVALVDLEDDNIKFWSRSALSLFGHSAHTAAEWYQLAYPDPDYRREVITLWKQVLEKARLSGQPVNAGEYRVTCRDGSVRLCELYATFLADTLIVTFNDITTRKQAEAALRDSHQLIQGIVNAIPVRVFWKDKNLVYLGCNTVFAHDAGLADPQDIIGKDDFQMGWREQAELYRADDRQVIESGSAKLLIEEPQTTPSGNTITLLTSKIPLRNGQGGIDGMIGVYLDITERKQMEAALWAKNKELEQFTYAVSHDLRSPLVTIQTFLGYLEEDIRDQAATNMAKDLAHIHAAADKMGRLLEELLKLSRAGHQTNTPEDVALSVIVNEVLALVAGQISQRGVQVVVAEPAAVLHGDRARLVAVFQNLVDNACKFMGDQKEPRLEIGVEQHKAEKVFFVRDNGSGIAPGQVENLFGLFVRLNPQVEGAGIGLAIVKRIVEVYGGRIWVESKGAGQGACFYFTLPGAVKQLQEGEKS